MYLVTYTTTEIVVFQQSTKWIANSDLSKFVPLLCNNLFLKPSFVCSNSGQISPVLTNHNFQYVHHMVVFICPGESNITSFSGQCKNVNSVPSFVRACTLYKALMSWAVGSQVGLPENSVNLSAICF